MNDGSCLAGKISRESRLGPCAFEGSTVLILDPILTVLADGNVVVSNAELAPRDSTSHDATQFDYFRAK